MKVEYFKEDELTREEVEEFLRMVVKMSSCDTYPDLPDIPSGTKMPFRITEGMKNPKRRKVRDLSEYREGEVICDFEIEKAKLYEDLQMQVSVQTDIEDEEKTIELSADELLAIHKKTKAWGIGMTEKEAKEDMIKCIEDTTLIMEKFGIILVEETK